MGLSTDFFVFWLFLLQCGLKYQLSDDSKKHIQHSNIVLIFEDNGFTIREKNIEVFYGILKIPLHEK